MFSYGALLKDSWRLIVKNKKLWLFALFISGGSLLLNLLPTDLSVLTLYLKFDVLAAYWSFYTGSAALLAIFLGTIVWTIVFGLISLICKAGLIRGIQTANNNQSVGVKENLKFGWKKLLPMFLLELFLALPTIVFCLVGLVLINLVSAVWPFLIIIVLVVLYNIFAWLFKNFAYCYLCYEEQTPQKAIFSGLSLFKKNIGKTLLVNLLRFVILLAVIVLTSLAAVMLESLFAALAYLTVKSDSEVGFTIVRYFSAIIGYVLTWGVLMLRNSYFYTLMSKTYLLLK
jgi:hypothetical protein